MTSSHQVRNSGCCFQGHKSWISALCAAALAAPSTQYTGRLQSVALASCCAAEATVFATAGAAISRRAGVARIFRRRSVAAAAGGLCCRTLVRRRDGFRLLRFGQEIRKSAWSWATSLFKACFRGSYAIEEGSSSARVGKSYTTRVGKRNRGCASYRRRP